MFVSMFRTAVSVVASSYLVPFWIACGGVIIAGACAVVIKGLFYGGVR